MSSRVHGAVALACTLTLTAAPLDASQASLAARADFRAQLALRWAPIHHQDVHSVGAHSLEGAADFITAFDFDFDDNSRNNWDNAGNPRFPLSAHAYFAVVETGSHWFVTYAFFHPRDWSARFLETEHENDSEGVLLAIARDGSRFGALRAAVTVSHSNFYSYVPAGSTWSSGQEDVDGRLHLEDFEGELHPVTAQQAETHALKAWPQFRIERQGIVYYPSLTRAEVPTSVNDRQVLYRLHDVQEAGGLWQKRHVGALFSRYGEFSGDTSGGCGRRVLWCPRNAAHTPWGWNDHDDRVPAGAMVRDPARLARSYFKSEELISASYRYNPFR